MPRTDQTQTAILGALSIMPMTGYALREEIRDTLGHFWSESFGQIYPALSDLERNGLVERQHIEGTRASKFCVTDAGMDRLRQLLSEAPQEPKPRNGLLLRLFFGGHLGPQECKRLVLEARGQAEAALEQMKAARSEASAGQLPDHAAPYILLTISAGEHSARATIAWADEALDQLSEIERTGGPLDRPRGR